VTGHIESLKASLYVLAQLIGGIIAAELVNIFVPGNFQVNNKVPPEVGLGSAFVAEIILTFVLMSIIYVSTAADSLMDVGFAPVLIGFALFVIHLAGIGISTTSVNPARSLGPSIIANNFENHWIYWIGPILGALLGSGFYKLSKMVTKRNA
jgi:aquaporin related protein